jgi:integrase
MTKLHLKYVQSYRGYHYFRRRGMPVIPLPGVVGSAEFMQAYQQALATAPAPIGASKRSLPGSISCALAEYFTSQSFRGLAAATQMKRRGLLERIREPHGQMQLASMPKEFVIVLLDTLTPHTAHSTLIALRHFTGWCVERKLMCDDPTFGVRLRMPKSDGHATWSEDEIARFEAAHAIGTKARLALVLGLYTAQRRADVIRIGRQHIRDGVLTVRQQKTGVTLAIPVHSDLAKIIAATQTGHLTLLTTKTGKSYEADDFSEQFRAWCNAAGLPQHCVFHGLRKAALTRLASLGCTVHEIAAISGHKSLKEVERYTRAFDQARLARAAMERFGAESVEPEAPKVSKPLIELPKKAG